MLERRRSGRLCVISQPDLVLSPWWMGSRSEGIKVSLSLISFSYLLMPAICNLSLGPVTALTHTRCGDISNSRRAISACLRGRGTSPVAGKTIRATYGLFIDVLHWPSTLIICATRRHSSCQIKQSMFATLNDATSIHHSTLTLSHRFPFVMLSCGIRLC